jgi:hypothetical protein
MSMLTPSGAGLVKLMGEMPRGPRREGVFALWLTLRVTEDLLLLPEQPERSVKRRVAALAQRLSSLSLPGALRRALISALSELEQIPRGRVGQVLLLLVAPTREALGPEAAELIARAARGAGQRIKEPG